MGLRSDTDLKAFSVYIAKRIKETLHTWNSFVVGESSPIRKEVFDTSSCFNLVGVPGIDNVAPADVPPATSARAEPLSVRG
jgi:hypothetical protein